MARRHMNNLGTGIQWSYGNDAPLDDGWRQNRKTGGWFKVEDELDLVPPPTPYTKKAVPCQYTNTYGSKCGLWNSGFRFCCDFKCKYLNLEKRDTRSITTCLRCAYYYQNACCHDESNFETDPSSAQYCCYFQTEENQKTLYERIRNQVITKYSTPPTDDSKIEATSQEKTDFHWLETDQRACPPR